MTRFQKLLLACAAFCTIIPAQAAEPIRPAIPSPEDAPIALLVDLSTGQTLFSRDEDRRFMPASITKVMTTFLAFEWMEGGRLFPQQVFTIRPETHREWYAKGSNMFLPADARITADELVHGITTVSANDAAVVLAEGAAGSVDDWLAAMNAKAREIGMRDSHFGTPNGWMDEGHTFVTAHDLATLARAMIIRHPSKYRHFVGAEGLEYNGVIQRNHDPISGVVEGADGIKTGFTNQAGYGFLGSAERNGRRLVMVVAASPTSRGRNDAARAFMEWGFSAFDDQVLFKTEERIGTADVQDGALRQVGLVAKAPVRVALPQGTQAKIDLAIRYDGPLKAPVAEGAEVARLVVSLDGRPINTIPLVAESSVLEATVLQRVFNGIAGWVG
ncbi:D-alanyl-D-alanine carboxypeptidase family protein [Qipengyuania spongiae]|uniref:serine-type D-Ala-D-Ala carboxypeptidase n=1 Tax=Qipengyuania spongiae TaxID=2909673 RepID=A0ABY5SXD5_9SPHN|nr:D-alanyl-D-alanine carboxypeptidase family protein [Qipengyuania spongiae]UVI38879.1 D-alanyl-D-alanine carboxypeptidase [Qipengyuania spongiae]